MKLLLSLSALAGAYAFVVQPNAFSRSGTTLFGNYHPYMGDDFALERTLQAIEGDTYFTQQRALKKTFVREPVTTQDMWRTLTPIVVQGESLRTCRFEENIQRAEVFLRTTGRPLNAEVKLWQGPDNTPQTVSIYLEDGGLRPFRATFECPGQTNSIAIRNTGSMEFPLVAAIDPDIGGPQSGGSPAVDLFTRTNPRTIQGGAVYTMPFSPAVQSVQVMVRTDGRPLNARIELLQGPNNNKQIMDIYLEDGRERPFYCIIDTPGSGNVVRIVNTATVEFPLFACLEPYMLEEGYTRPAQSGGRLSWS